MLTILGGGPAGLAAGYYARRVGHRFRILEAAASVGGHCITEERHGFRFDRGAHRFHDKDPDVTADVLKLLGHEMTQVSAPSAIHAEGRFLPFPPSPRHLLAHLGPGRFAAAAAAAFLARLSDSPVDSFEAFAHRAYGPRLARMFLLNYSEKLWGRPCAELSPAISGGRLRGLKLSALLARRGRRAEHLDGTFYYPAAGYGRIVERMAEECGPDAIRCDARITRLAHDGRRITHVEVHSGETLPVDTVASTLPLGVTLRALDPRPPDHVLALAERIRFRHVLLAAWFLRRPSVTHYATVYFPGSDVPFTRVSEPRNRSASMAPLGHTSLVAEIPCAEVDHLWSATDSEVTTTAQPALERLGWVHADEIVGTAVVRLQNAYPVLTLEAESAAAEVARYLGRFDNLHLLGRNGLFQYGWLHSVMRMARKLVDELPRFTG